MKTLNKKQKVLPGKGRAQPLRQLLASGESGFTLLEIIVVVLMVAILSAIAAPGWLAFVNRQRVSKMNDAVFSAIQEAKQEARLTSRSYNVSFRVNNNIPEVAVYQAEDETGNDITLNTASNAWQPLSQDLDIKEGQILLCSNIDATNTAGSTTCNFSTPRTIRFDFQGTLDQPDGVSPNIGNNGIGIIVAIPQSNNAQQPIPSTARCVMVKTLIGSMQLGQDEYDATSNPQGCPL
jgi:prepilin-type N-terminal cleavage/methylation domain-containing protein